jgi:hypothetical protein
MLCPFLSVCMSVSVSMGCPCPCPVHLLLWGLLDRSTARYFYKGSKTILHKSTANSGINLFIKNVDINIIYNFCNKDLSVKQTVFTKKNIFFRKLHFLQYPDCNGT